MSHFGESKDMMSAAEAQRFYAEGMDQLDHLLLGEEEAKLGMLVAMASGLNVVLVGEPGGGKTTLAFNAHRIVEDIKDDNVAIVPPLSDLTPQQLVGGETIVDKKITIDGKPHNETTRTGIDPLIHSGTQVIVANEVNRMNPFAVNSILEALESGRIDTTAGTTYLNDLEFSVSTMNPAEARQAVFPMAAAAASRHAIGAELGHRTDIDRRKDIMLAQLGGFEPSPDAMEPVTDIDSLHRLQQRANHGVAFPESLKLYAVETIAAITDGLAANNIHEADGRLVKHVSKIARTIAALNGQQGVEAVDVVMAARFVTTARLGILGVRGSNTSIYEAVEDILGAK